MDFLFDVADLPVALTRWNSHKLSENGEFNIASTPFRNAR